MKPTFQTVPDLLEFAGLPHEKKCIGKIFAFTWCDQDGLMHRAVGSIDGLQIEESDDSGRFHLKIISYSLCRRRSNATNPPTILMTGGNLAGPPAWWVCFNDLGPTELSSPENPQVYLGKFELL